ncbi:MAG: hypothetical protein D0528_01160 [Methylococcales bacterium]|nr:MAG: hypothetical protein D0528_01160 [Methylococcales bacterium]
MVAAKLANISLGDNQHVGGSANLQTQTSRADAAKMLNVSERSVNSAKKVEQNAIPEIIEKVE